jgi:hypothetical protein
VAPNPKDSPFGKTTRDMRGSALSDAQKSFFFNVGNTWQYIVVPLDYAKQDAKARQQAVDLLKGLQQDFQGTRLEKELGTFIAEVQDGNYDAKKVQDEYDKLWTESDDIVSATGSPEATWYYDLGEHSMGLYIAIKMGDQQMVSSEQGYLKADSSHAPQGVPASALDAIKSLLAMSSIKADDATALSELDKLNSSFA